MSDDRLLKKELLFVPKYHIEIESGMWARRRDAPCNAEEDAEHKRITAAGHDVVVTVIENDEPVFDYDVFKNI